MNTFTYQNHHDTAAELEALYDAFALAGDINMTYTESYGDDILYVYTTLTQSQSDNIVNS